MMCVMVSVLHKYGYTHIEKKTTGRKQEFNTLYDGYLW